MAPDKATKNGFPDRFTIFAFLWACQALVHQEFYSAWVDNNNLLGWILTASAMVALLKPSSVVLFSAMLVSSIVYNVAKWPFVVNHILVESVIDLTILAALGASLLHRRGESTTEESVGNESYDRFAPVVRVMLVVVYYFAFVAKLNWGFINPDVSCVVVMYGDLVNRFPFLPENQTAYWMVIWATLVVEAAIPLLLSFRVTRYWGVLIGVPFHIVLGLVGHRTFSALAFALYALFCMEELVLVVRVGYARLERVLGSERLRVVRIAASACLITMFSGMIAADLTGNYDTGVGPFKVFRVAWVIWILWSLLLGVAFAAAAWICFRRTVNDDSSPFPVTRPGFLWLVVLIVVFNGLTQYLGVKTETCFTMYSNLRTEADFNNHFFMPALRLGSYQTDLVKIEKTTHPELKKYEESRELVTWFELRRIVSSTETDFVLAYRRDGALHEVSRRDGVESDSELFRPHPIWLAKLLYFRPVSMEECAVCQH